MPFHLRKVEHVAARFSPEERSELERAAARQGKKLSEWMREVLLAAARSAAARQEIPH